MKPNEAAVIICVLLLGKVSRKRVCMQPATVKLVFKCMSIFKPCGKECRGWMQTHQEQAWI